MPGYPSGGGVEEAQRVQDREHLRLLVIGHYVYAGITALLSLIPLIHVGVGLLMTLSPAAAPPPSGGGPPPTWFGLFFVVLGGVFILVGETLAALTYLAGRAIQQRKSRVFILVINAINCLNVPLGALLGVFTFVVLSRQSVQAEFAGGAPDEPHVPRWPDPV